METVSIQLSQGKVAIIDAADAALVAGYNWHLGGGRGSSYAQAHTPGRNRTVVRMHRLILGFPSGSVDHINGDRLDNRRENLRVCTNSENQRNRPRSKRTGGSLFKGVYLAPCKSKPFTARIAVDGKSRYLGLFETEVEAARAYDAA